MCIRDSACPAPCDLTETLATSPSDSPAACHGYRSASRPAGASGGLPGGGMPKRCGGGGGTS
eukprot:13631758-Alexandrium_andersonii.AAC.1